LICERFISLKTARIAPPKLLDEAITVSSRSLPTPDVVNQLAQSSALGEVLASGLRALNNNPQCSEADLRATMEGRGRAVAHRLEKYLSALGTIASAAPLLGLLGTVIGMIEIFGSQGSSGSMGGGNPAQLAHGISIALYNTAFGLIVAIPALIFWRYFRGRVDAYLLTLELASEQFVRHILRHRK
jgi:biopolymer transport protein ExbB